MWMVSLDGGEGGCVSSVQSLNLDSALGSAGPLLVRGVQLRILKFVAPASRHRASRSSSVLFVWVPTDSASLFSQRNWVGCSTTHGRSRNSNPDSRSWHLARIVTDSDWTAWLYMYMHLS